MDSSIIVRKINDDEIGWVNAKYDEVEFVHSDPKKEVIAVAEYKGQRAGIGRLVSVSTTEAELGGMYVFEAFRGHGIAGKIVEFLLDHAKDCQIVFCLPFSHLRSFYQKYGFVDYSSQLDLNVPAEVLKKHQWCNKTYKHKTLLFVRSLK